MATKLYNSLCETTNEKGVEHIYWEYISKSLRSKNSTKNNFKSVGRTDGIVLTQCIKDGKALNYSILLEVKFDKSLKDISKRADVILQAICYLKQHQNTRLRELPRVVIIGNKYSCFVIPVTFLLPYVSRQIVGYDAASTAHSMSANSSILSDIKEDAQLRNIKIYDILETTSTFDAIVDKCNEEAQGVSYRVKITDDSIEEVFKDFTDNVCNLKSGEQWDGQIKKFLFMGMVLNGSYYDEQSGKVGFKVSTDVNGNPVLNHRKVNKDAYYAFMNFYDFKYTEGEKRKFTEICDRLIDEQQRHESGDYYTPAHLAHLSHDYLKKQLGNDFPKNYLVWDCCCGTMNLTRDLGFNNLYSSTLESGDIDICASRNYNKGEHNYKFVYDFLNTDVERQDKLYREKVLKGIPLELCDFEDWNLYYLPGGKELISALLNGKKCLFYINPPYGTASAPGYAGKTNYKPCVAKETKMNVLMDKKHYNVGKCSQNMYSQFIYRILLLQKLFANSQFTIGLFSPMSYITAQSFELFRPQFEDVFGLLRGFYFKGSEFPNVNPDWNLTFAIWQKGVKSNYTFDILEKVFGEYKITGKKVLYSINSSENGSTWCKDKLDTPKNTKDMPNMSSGLKGVSERSRGSMLPSALGYYYNISNIVGTSKQLVYIGSSCASGGNGISITFDNFDKVISMFSARFVIGRVSDWVTYWDEFAIPDILHKDYKKWLGNCLVYSIFSGKSNMTSLRNIEYHSKDFPDKHIWDIHNNFFFMSRKDMLTLAEKYTYNDMEQDLYNSDDQDERYVYSLLKSGDYLISGKAKELLDLACGLVEKSFPYREEFNKRVKDINGVGCSYHLHAWDAGWYQLSDLIQETNPSDYKKFEITRYELEEEMRDMVYDLGFLKK